MDEREDRQAVSTKGGVISHRPCCTPPAQCCYKRKEDNGRGMKDIKHHDVRRRRREREEMFGQECTAQTKLEVRRSQSVSLRD